MLAALTVVLELTRVDEPDDPHAFRFEPQGYTLRSSGGGIERFDIPWTLELLQDLEALRRPGRDPAGMQRIGRIPGVVLEPNAYPGMANKAVAPLVQRIFLAFESTVQWFDRRKVSVVGNPVRRAFLETPASPSDSVKEGGARHLLIFGGSQGAKAINSAVIEALPLLGAVKERLTITHQTGEADHARVLAAYAQAGMSAQVVPFLYDMPAVLREADLVVARSGAMTIAELTVCGKPAILIPLPTAIYNHQLRNAEVMAQAGGAILLPQAELTGAGLANAITGIFNNPERLQTMSRHSWEMRRSDAAEAIVRECYDVIRRRHEASDSARAL